jgi:hypothetical protein
VEYFAADKGADALRFRRAIDVKELFRKWFAIGKMALIQKSLEGDLTGEQLS